MSLSVDRRTGLSRLVMGLAGIGAAAILGGCCGGYVYSYSPYPCDPPPVYRCDPPVVIGPCPPPVVIIGGGHHGHHGSHGRPGWR